MKNKTMIDTPSLIARVRDVAEGLCRIREFEAAGYLNSYGNLLQESMDVQTSVSPEIASDQAVEFDEVWSDIDYLISRVEQGTLSRTDVVTLIRGKIGSSYHDRVMTMVDEAKSTFILDGETVQIRGSQHSVDRVENRIHITSDRLGDLCHSNPPSAPEEHTKDQYEQDENGEIDTYAYGHMDGWND